MRVAAGVDGVQQMVRNCGRRQWNHCRIFEEGLVEMQKRSRSEVWSLCGRRLQCKLKPMVVF